MAAGCMPCLKTIIGLNAANVDVLGSKFVGVLDATANLDSRQPIIALIYSISCFQTNLPVFKVKESSVRRRYSDFEWLRTELERDSKVSDNSVLIMRKIVIKQQFYDD